MNRLQKKCLVATAGFHLLLILILIVGPGFFRETPKPDDTQLLDVIPATAIDAALNSGVKNAQPPAPTPPMIPPPKPIVLPQPQPQPPPTPPPPAPQPVTPAPSFVDRMKNFFKPEPETPAPTPDDSPKPVEHKKPHKINVDLSNVTRTTVAKSEPHRTSDDSKREERLRASAIQNAVRNLEKNFTPSTKVEMPGSSSVSYASYASIIKSIYTREWTPPDNAANDEANIKVSITVSSDGTVVSAHIVDPSGDSSVDDSVQRTLDRVTFIAPFPDGATEKEKTFIINFNLKAKRMLG
jgi:periplasmic protein TonB